MLKPVGREQLGECLGILRESYEAVALELGITEENSPHRARTRLPLEVLEGEMEAGASMYGYWAGGRMVGFLSVSRKDTSPEGSSPEKMGWKLNDLAVLPPYQGRGIGGEMVGFLKRLVKESGGGTLSLGMIGENKSLREWYARRGFAVAGSKQYPNAPYTVCSMEWSADRAPERFAVPAVGAIVVREEDGGQRILIQERWKEDAPEERGLLEIPAGKVREFEDVFDTLRREIWEETGLRVTSIQGEEGGEVYSGDRYRVRSFRPYACSQNLAGDYPILVMVFLCTVDREIPEDSNEARNHRWMGREELRERLRTDPAAFYPMHVAVLRQWAEL